MKEYTSVIAAVSTPPGKGGVAIIRLSGEGALDVAASIFFPKSKKSFSEAIPRMQIYGKIVLAGEEIDDGMATYFQAPASYTGEDMVEISCHGGTTVTSLVLETVLSAGAVLAGPGQFTERAFINGKLSLTDAEAIGNLLEARGREEIKLFTSDKRGRLAGKISEIKDGLISIMSSVYARIDYPDEDLGELTDEEILKLLSEVLRKMQTLSESYKTTKAISEGIKTVIAGKTNVGKSSLYNMILGEDAAIVTDIEGTTRDVLSSTAVLGRVKLNLFDTAGVREFSLTDKVEAIGIERTLAKLSEAELVLAVFDASQPLDDRDKEILARILPSSARKIAILNKCDKEILLSKSALFDGFDYILEISASRADEGDLKKLCDAVDRLFLDEKISLSHDAIITSARQNSELSLAISYVESARSALLMGMSIDAVSSDIERALEALSSIDGKAVSEAVVADIFSKFCVGK